MADALVDRLDQTIDRILARRDASPALSDPELALLAVLANELRHCPSAAFKSRLRATLERRTTMTRVLEPTEIRQGFTTVTPYIRMRESGLLEFLTRVFGAEETFSIKGDAGGVHREVRVGDSMLMIGEGGVEGSFPGSSVTRSATTGISRHTSASRTCQGGGGRSRRSYIREACLRTSTF